MSNAIFDLLVHSVDRRVLFFLSPICSGRLLKKLVNHFVDLALASLVPCFLGSLVPWFSLTKLLCSRVGTFSLSETSACADTSFSCTSEWREIPLVCVLQCGAMCIACWLFWSVYVGESELLIKVQAPWLKLLIFEADF